MKNEFRKALDKFNEAVKMFEQVALKSTQSILDGKVAIAVNNEREFKLLMEHYESKGWKWRDGDSPIGDYIPSKRSRNIEYHDLFAARTDEGCERDGYTIIPFTDLAAEVGIKVPVFFMTAEDGETIYYGDDFVYVWQTKGVWEVLNTYTAGKDLKNSFEFEEPENKAFSTREAAEKWIEEQNKPKEFELEISDVGSITISGDKIKINGSVNELDKKQIEKLIAEYNNLQPF